MLPSPLEAAAPNAEPRVWTDTRRLRVRGIGHALPGEPVSTADLLAHLDRRFGTHLAERGALHADKLGVRTRHICRDFEAVREGPRAGDSNPELAARALRRALDAAGLRVDDLSYLIGHTATPALPIPSNIALVADRLDFHGPHMELRQACTGFASALVTAQGLLATPGCGPVAIVGSETGSVHLDPRRAERDLGQLVNLVMMGDGAGAVVLERADEATEGPSLTNLFVGQVGGGRAPGLQRSEGGSARPFTDHAVLAFDHDYAGVRESGAELFLRGAAVAHGLGLGPLDADRVLPHQASGRLAAQFERRLGVPAERVFIHADRVGNTGSAAIWLALSELSGDLAEGETVCVLGAEATKHLFAGFAYTHR
ncbi:ketoacyl-ACP synthase III [soil metagenome]